MLGNDNIHPDQLYVLDTSTISQSFGAYYRSVFVSFWRRFEALVQSGSAVSVAQVRRELEESAKPEVARSPDFLENLNSNFFNPPTSAEQELVNQMLNAPSLSAANNRWRSKLTRGIEDADPYLIARARSSSIPVVVVTEESQNITNHPGAVPAVCRRFEVDCINLRQLMESEGWRF